MKNDFDFVDWMDFYRELPKETQKRIRKRHYILHTETERPFFRFHDTRYYLDEVDYNGYSMTDICNVGYLGGFRVIGFDHVNDTIVLGRVDMDGNYRLNKR